MLELCRFAWETFELRPVFRDSWLEFRVYGLVIPELSFRV